MGSCLGHCHPSKESFSLYKFYSKASDTVQINNFEKSESEEHILNDLPSLKEKSQELNNSEFDIGSRGITCFCFGRLKSAFFNTKTQYVEGSTLRLELLEDEWSVSEGEGELSKRNEAPLVPLRSSGKSGREYTSASVNSLDLEWEHLPEMMVFSNNQPEKEEPKSVTSAEAWSRVSDSADSLEWDLAEVELKEEIDTETEQLLQEIEMLSSKTLEETHEWAS